MAMDVWPMATENLRGPKQFVFKRETGVFSICTAVLTGEQGFEPRLTDPESVVLPLHYSPNYWDQYRSGRKTSSSFGLLCEKYGEASPTVQSTTAYFTEIVLGQALPYNYFVDFGLVYS